MKHCIEEALRKWMTKLRSGPIFQSKTPDSSTRALVNLTSSHIVANKEGFAKEVVNLAYEISLSYFEEFYNMPLNLAIWRRGLYFPLEGRRAANLYRPYTSIAFARFEPANLGSNGKRANYYTTRATSYIRCFCYKTSVLVSCRNSYPRDVRRLLLGRVSHNLHIHPPVRFLYLTVVIFTLSCSLCFR
jgi:hypothetical protein